MKILAIHTSSPICSVCLLENNNVIQELHISDEKTHSQKLMPLIDKLLFQNSLELNNIDLFVCDIGPGSFTGVRIGVSTIKAFVDVTNKPVIGISSLEGLAYNTFSAKNFENIEYVCSLIDAKNDNVYFGLFKKTNENTFEILENLDCQNINEVITLLQNKYLGKRIYFIGDGATSHRYNLLENLSKPEFIDEILNHQSSSSIGEAGYFNYINNPTHSFEIHPLYLRKSQAERALNGEK